MVRGLGIELPEHADGQQGFALCLIEMLVRALATEGEQSHRMIGNQQYHHQYNHATEQSISGLPSADNLENRSFTAAVRYEHISGTADGLDIARAGIA
jgi:hypothetical protein